MRLLLAVLLALPGLAHAGASGGGSSGSGTVSTTNPPITGDGSSGTPLNLDSSSATLQGNTFNAAGKLLQINANGNVGVSTATPSQKIDVAGFINTSSGFMLNNSSLAVVNVGTIGSYAVICASATATTPFTEVSGTSVFGSRRAIDLSRYSELRAQFSTQNTNATLFYGGVDLSTDTTHAGATWTNVVPLTQTNQTTAGANVVTAWTSIPAAFRTVVIMRSVCQYDGVGSRTFNYQQVDAR